MIFLINIGFKLRKTAKIKFSENFLRNRRYKKRRLCLQFYVCTTGQTRQSRPNRPFLRKRKKKCSKNITGNIAKTIDSNSSPTNETIECNFYHFLANFIKI